MLKVQKHPVGPLFYIFVTLARFCCAQACAVHLEIIHGDSLHRVAVLYSFQEIEEVAIHFLKLTGYWIMTGSKALLLSVLERSVIFKLSNLRTRMSPAQRQ